jgi:hypothetical protein
MNNNKPIFLVIITLVLMIAAAPLSLSSSVQAQQLQQQPQIENKFFMTFKIDNPKKLVTLTQTRQTISTHMT